MGYSRRVIFTKGLGTMEVLRVEPTVDTDFVKTGFLQKLTFSDEHGMVEIRGDNGHLLNQLSGTQKVSGVASLWQTDKDAVDLLAGATEQAHCVRYHGMASPTKWQYWGVQLAKIVPNVGLEFASATARVLPMSFAGLKDMETAYDHPVYWLVERDGAVLMDKLALWASPRQLLNTGTVYLLDVSGWKRNGTVYPSGDASAIWTVSAAPYFLRLDGTDQYVDFGDVLDDDGSGDFLLELWVRVMGADASLQELLSKRAGMTDEAGFHLVRTAANKIEFEIGDGSAPSATVTGSGNVLQNVWKHVAVAVDRSGNAQLYLNGAADGAAVAVSGVGSGTNAVSLYLGRLASAYGQVDLGDFRAYRWAGGALPATIGTTVAAHFAAEQAHYGV